MTIKTHGRMVTDNSISIAQLNVTDGEDGQVLKTDGSGTLSFISQQILSIGDNSVTGAKIAMGSDVAGDVLYYNGTDYVRLPKGTASQHLAINAGATAPEWVTPPTTAGVVQMVYDGSAARYAVATDTSNEAYQSDVLPTISFGSQFMSATITPQSASNILIVEHLGFYHDAHTSALLGPMTAIFAGNTCIGAAVHDIRENDYIINVNVKATFVAGTTSALVITARASGAGTLTFNGKTLSGSTDRKYNTAQKSSLIVTEYTP